VTSKKSINGNKTPLSKISESDKEGISQEK
jgi:hypothetical protein